MGFWDLAIKIPQLITMTIFSKIASHLSLFKSPPYHTSSSAAAAAAGNHILILDSSSPSLIPVPVHSVTASIKKKVPIIPYSDFANRYGGATTAECTVCLDSIDSTELIRELLNCKHVFHRECLDRWIDEGKVYCPLCRSILLPPKKLLSSVAGAIDPVI